MAGSRTMIPGVIYSSTALSVPNSSSSISNNSQNAVYNNGLLHSAVNGSVNAYSNGITNSHLFKPSGKLIVQGSSNGTTLLVGSLSNNTISTIKSENNSHCLTNTDNLIVPVTKDNNFISPIQTTNLQQTFKEEKDVIEILDDEPEIISEEVEEPVIDIMINNVVCSFSVGCHLDLRNIALSGYNVEYRRENGMVTMKLRRPRITASVWSSGKITCTGSTSEAEARVAARRVARTLQKLGYNARFRNYRVVNVLGTCTMPFAIRIAHFSVKYRHEASYEPELHPGVTYRIVDPKATLKIFSTGSITVTAPCVNNVQSAIEHIYPLVKEFSKERSKAEEAEMKKNSRRVVTDTESEEDSEEESDSEDSD